MRPTQEVVFAENMRLGPHLDATGVGDDRALRLALRHDGAAQCAVAIPRMRAMRVDHFALVHPLRTPFDVPA